MQPLPAGVIQDSVPSDAPGAREIGFNIPARYNASEVLFRNLNEGHGLALTGPCGQVTYHELCAAAERWGNAFLSLGLHRGERIVFFLDDTPVYPAAFFGAVRADLVPLLINLLTPSDLLQFYLAGSGATIAVTEAACVEKFNATACANTELKTLVIVNGQVVSASSVGTINAASWLRTFSSALVPADTHRDEMAFWMYSSGSTGRPKGIVHLQHDMIYTDLAYARSILRAYARRYLFLGAEDLLCLRVRQFHHLSFLCRGGLVAAPGAAQARGHLRSNRGLSADRVLCAAYALHGARQSTGARAG